MTRLAAARIIPVLATGEALDAVVQQSRMLCKNLQETLRSAGRKFAKNLIEDRILYLFLVVYLLLSVQEQAQPADIL